MPNTYSIQILDSSNKIIGELMTASSSDVLKFLNKGFKVINKMNGMELSESDVTSTVGVSDGLINVG